MAITAAMVKELRTKTGAGMMDCKKALTESNGDMEKAVDLLREHGLAAAAKKADRIAAEGLVYSYIHGNGRIGVLVEVNCETDFVAQTDNFKALCKDIAMQIAAAKPAYLKREEVPAEVLEHEKEVLRQQALNEGKPEKIVEKMIVKNSTKKTASSIRNSSKILTRRSSRSLPKRLLKSVKKSISAVIHVMNWVKAWKNGTMILFPK